MPARAFVATRVAGVIVTPHLGRGRRYLLKQHVAVVRSRRQFSRGRCDGVVIDNAGAARRITEHLLDLGHRRIALFIDETNWTTGNDRYTGFREALTASDAGWEDSLLVRCRLGCGDGAHRGDRRSARRDHPTATIQQRTTYWQRASGARQATWACAFPMTSASCRSRLALDEHGLPRDHAVAQDAVALGRAAVARLLDRLADRDLPPTVDVIDAQVMARGSMAAPRRV